MPIATPAAIRARALAVVLLAAFCPAAPAQAQSDPAALYEEGVAARRAGRHQDAIRLLSTVLSEQPENVDARLQLGLSLAARRRFDDAKRELTRVIEKAPDYHDARIGLARIAFWRGQFADAQREIDTVRQRAPDNAEAKALADQIARAKAKPPRETRVAPPTPELSAAPPARKQAVVTSSESEVLRGRALRRTGRFAEAEEIFRSALSRSPRDADLWVDLGLAIAFQNRFGEARPAFERALALNPRAADAVLGLGRLDLYTDALASAQTRVDQVLAANPNNRDARMLSARIRLARGDAEGAEVEFRQLAAAHPGELDFQVGLGDALRAQLLDDEARVAFEAAARIDPNSVDVQNRLAVRKRPRWRLDIDGSYSWLTQGLEPWREGRVALGYTLTARTTVTGSVDVNHRFGLTDVLVDGRVDHRWSNLATAYLRLGGTPDADFRPRFLIEGGGSLQMSPRSGAIGPTLATIDLSYARYPTAEVVTVSPGLQQYFLDGRLWFTGRLIGTRSDPGGDLGGYVVRMDWAPSERWSLFVGYADAPDTSEGRTFEARSVFGGVAVALAENWTLRLSVAQEDRQNSYDRTTVNAGLTTRF